MNTETVKQYFDLLEDTLKELYLVSRPAQVYNVDETGILKSPMLLLREVQKSSIQSIREEGASNHCRMCECSWAGNSTNGHL